MFTTLLESGAPHPRRAGETFLSVAAHGAIIAVAVIATMSGRAGDAAIPPHPPSASIVYVAPPDPIGSTSASPTASSAPDPTRLQQLVKSIREIELPSMPDLRTIDLSPRSIDGEAAAIVGRGGISPMGAVGSASRGDGLGAGGVLAEHDVDRAPRTLGTPPVPRYPEALRSAGITGRVIAQFVVDTLGRAEPGSVEFLEATRAEFADAVRAVLPRMRFSPGEVGGRAVRTRVQIPFEFTLR